MDKQTKGRPQRSKESYQKEVRKLRIQVKDLQKSNRELVIIFDEHYKKLSASKLRDRLRYLITGEL